MVKGIHLSSDEDALFGVLPANGSTISNPRAQQTLGWSDQRYWAARDALDNKRLIQRGQGRGGTLRRTITAVEERAVEAAPETAEEERAAAATIEVIRREEQLYDPIRSVLSGAWAKERRSAPAVIDVTARQGSRSTGGRWSRPDLVWVEVRTFEYLPTKVLDVITFEVKPSDAIDVQAVYEAVAHRRASTHAYVILDVPDSRVAALASTIDAVVQASREHGVGVITMGDPGDFDTWDEIQKAERFEPNPERLNDFLDTQLTRDSASKIRRAVR